MALEIRPVPESGHRKELRQFRNWNKQLKTLIFSVISNRGKRRAAFIFYIIFIIVSLSRHLFCIALSVSYRSSSP